MKAGLWLVLLAGIPPIQAKSCKVGDPSYVDRDGKIWFCASEIKWTRGPLTICAEWTKGEYVCAQFSLPIPKELQ